MLFSDIAFAFDDAQPWRIKCANDDSTNIMHMNLLWQCYYQFVEVVFALIYFIWNEPANFSFSNQVASL